MCSSHAKTQQNYFGTQSHSLRRQRDPPSRSPSWNIYFGSSWIYLTTFCRHSANRNYPNAPHPLPIRSKRVDGGEAPQPWTKWNGSTINLISLRSRSTTRRRNTRDSAASNRTAWKIHHKPTTAVSRDGRNISPIVSSLPAHARSRRGQRNWVKLREMHMRPK